MLDETCRRYPDHIAVVQEERRLTYAALNAAVNALGNALKNLGLGKNDKLAIVLPNCPEFIISISPPRNRSGGGNDQHGLDAPRNPLSPDQQRCPGSHHHIGAAPADSNPFFRTLRSAGI
jgi:hypothetical protein